MFALCRAEALKLHRRLAPALIILCPVLVLILCTLVTWAATSSNAKGQDSYTPWVMMMLYVWGSLVLPFFIAIAAHELAAVEHQNHQWKHLHALPVPRWSHVLAKQAALSALVFLGHLAFGLGILLTGALLHLLRPHGGFGTPPWSLLLAALPLCWLASSAMQALHQWISLRHSSLVAGMGSVLMGATGMILVMRSPTAGRFYPWGMPIQVMKEWTAAANGADHPAWVVGISLLMALAMLGLACIDATRLERA